MSNYKYKDRNIGRAVDQARANDSQRKQFARSRTFHCSTCSHCELDQFTSTPAECNIVSSTKELSWVVDALPFCPIGDIDPSFQKKVLCPVGNRDRRNTCGNCKYGDPVTCQLKSEDPKIKTFTQLYLCKNPRNEEHYTKGTALRSYIGCEHFEPR